MSDPVRSSDTLEVSLSESRYDRQERVSWWDQHLLASSRVLVVGAGALGNEVVKNLVLVGVGDIVVIDLDVIEASNLARCVFFRAEDEGQPKSPTLARRAAELNPDVTISGVVGDIRAFGTGIAYRADVIVGALDNREARLYCNRLAARSRSAWVDGAIEGLSGVARVFQPPESCYECTLTEADWETLAHRQSCRLLSRQDLESGKVPTTASTSSIVAGVQSQEVVKLLHRDRTGVQPMPGGVVFDGVNNDSYPLRYPTDEYCQAHHYYDDPVVIDPAAAPAAPREPTARSIATAAWPEVADTSRLVVDLADDLVIGWLCIDCDRTDSDGRPAALVDFGEALCATCGSLRQPTAINSIHLDGDQADRPLAALGVRPDEVLPVRLGLDERFVWIARPDPALPATWSRPTARQATSPSKGTA